MSYQDYYIKEYGKGDYPKTLNRKQEIIEKVKDLHLVSPILDIGCSDGFLVDYLRKQGYDAYGIDLRVSDNKYLSKANIEEIIPERTYNTIIMIDVLEHIFDYDKTLQNISFSLNPGGLLYIHIPYVFSLKNRIKMLFGYDPINSIQEKGHIRFYSIGFIKNLLSLYRLEVIDVIGYGKLKFKPSFCGSIMIIARRI